MSIKGLRGRRIASDLGDYSKVPLLWDCPLLKLGCNAEPFKSYDSAHIRTLLSLPPFIRSIGPLRDHLYIDLDYPNDNTVRCLTCHNYVPRYELMANCIFRISNHPSNKVMLCSTCTMISSQVEITLAPSSYHELIEYRRKRHLNKSQKAFDDKDDMTGLLESVTKMSLAFDGRMKPNDVKQARDRIATYQKRRKEMSEEAKVSMLVSLLDEQTILNELSLICDRDLFKLRYKHIEEQMGKGTHGCLVM